MWEMRMKRAIMTDLKTLTCLLRIYWLVRANSPVSKSPQAWRRSLKRRSSEILVSDSCLVQAPALDAFTAERQGHAIEVRLNAEDPLHDYSPSSGILGNVSWPAPEEGMGRPILCRVPLSMTVPAVPEQAACNLAHIRVAKFLTQVKTMLVNLA